MTRNCNSDINHPSNVIHSFGGRTAILSRTIVIEMMTGITNGTANLTRPIYLGNNELNADVQITAHIFCYSHFNNIFLGYKIFHSSLYLQDIVFTFKLPRQKLLHLCITDEGIIIRPTSSHSSNAPSACAADSFYTGRETVYFKSVKQKAIRAVIIPASSGVFLQSFAVKGTVVPVLA